MAPAFHKLAQFMKGYATYCGNHPPAQEELLAATKRHEKLRKKFKVLEDEAGGRNIFFFLIKPVQVSHGSPTSSL